MDVTKLRICKDEINSELNFRERTGNWNQGLEIYSDEQPSGISALLRLAEERTSPDVCRCAAIAIMCIREDAQVFMHRPDERDSGVTRALRILTEYVEERGGMVNLGERIFFHSLCETADRLDDAWYWARNNYEESPKLLKELILVLQADGTEESRKRAEYVKLLLEAKEQEEMCFNTGQLMLNCVNHGGVEDMPHGRFLLDAVCDGTNVVLILRTKEDDPDMEPRVCSQQIGLKELCAMRPEAVCEMLGLMAFCSA